ncbi:MAG TPA: DUF1116 domain-containing protein [Chloroflexota bacterium]|nr:DUF1116 domain-containing protein [Chloroflexota bacterium]
MTAILGGTLGAVNVGLELFERELREQGVDVAGVDWRPSSSPAIETLARLWRPDVEDANRLAIRRLLDAHQFVVDVQPAGEVIPGLTKDTLLHAGPPIAWERMSGPLRGAVVGGLLFEGLAASPEEAERLAASGNIRFDSCHHHQAVGPMAGVTSCSMPVYVVEDRVNNRQAYSTLNEGLGKVLRYGAYDAEVMGRLAWMRDSLGPALGAALRRSGGIDVRALIGQAVQMGDECHNRNRAASALFVKALAPWLAAEPSGDLARIFEFMGGNEHFFLNAGMAACKLACDAAHGQAGSTLVTAMARNGTDFGIRVSGLGDRWFTAQAEVPEGLYFPGYGPDDANPDIGDSAITETGGLGGFAMAAAPAIVQFVGGTPSDALGYTKLMREIVLADSEAYKIPIPEFRGTPTGIDLRLVLQTGILPQVNTGIAHRLPGIGQIGAGLVKPPRDCFEQALSAFTW